MRHRASALALASMFATALLGGCAHAPAPKPEAAAPQPAIPDALSPLPAQYAGTLPCGPDCDGIAFWLTLGPRGVYVLQQHYNTRDDTADYVEVGRWKTRQDGTRIALTPADSDESGASLWGVADRARLLALDGQGQPVAPLDDYTLHRRADASAQSFDDTDWYLVNAPDAHQGGDAYIRFDSDDDRLVGSTGCNQLSADYKRDEEALRVMAPATTRRACLDFEDTEQSMLEALRQTRRARVLGNYLLLFGAAGDRSPLAIFQAKTEAMPLSH